MADVYRARDTELGRDVAVKVFRADDDTVADLQRREREIRLLSRLNHPGLVGIHDAGVLMHEGVARRYVVMEYVEGRSLAHRLARGPMKPRQVADIGAQMADALSYVHGHGIVHRDVKPENILVAEVPTLGYTLMAKLADFGVAQFIDGSRLTATARSWAPPPTSRPSRRAARRSARRATSTRSASCSSRPCAASASTPGARSRRRSRACTGRRPFPTTCPASGGRSSRR